MYEQPQELNKKWFSEEEIKKVLDEQLPSSFKVSVRRQLFGEKEC